MSAVETTKSISAVMLGAGLLAGVYVLLTSRLLPDPISVIWDLPTGTAGPVRWLVGWMSGIIIMSAWYALRGAMRNSKASR
jgi:hypothetical protein